MLAVHGDGQFAAVGHGVAGVDGEIEEDLLHLGRSERNIDGIPDFGDDDDVLGEQAAESVGLDAHGGGEIDRLALGGVAAAEGEQTLRELGSVVAGPLQPLVLLLRRRRCLRSL